jgi:hypothetical protein
MYVFISNLVAGELKICLRQLEERGNRSTVLGNKEEGYFLPFIYPQLVWTKR